MSKRNNVSKKTRVRRVEHSSPWKEGNYAHVPRVQKVKKVTKNVQISAVKYWAFMLRNMFGNKIF